MVVTKCDRCGKIFTPKKFITSEKVVCCNEIEDYDLCDECMELLENCFMKGKAIKEVDNGSH